MYCRHCGAEMNSDAPVCPSCGVSSGSGSTYCANCGAECQPGAVFCSHCGCQFAPEQAQQTLLSGSLTAVLSKPGISGGGAGYQAPGQDYQPPVYPPVGTPLKSKMAAGLLGIFLGAFGVHNFYLGYTTKAVIQLCLTLLSCGILSFASGIWGFIEGIMLLTGSINVDGNRNAATAIILWFLCEQAEQQHAQRRKAAHEESPGFTGQG